MDWEVTLKDWTFNTTVPIQPLSFDFRFWFKSIFISALMECLTLWL